MAASVLYATRLSFNNLVDFMLSTRVFILSKTNFCNFYALCYCTFLWLVFNTFLEPSTCKTDSDVGGCFMWLK